MKYSSLIVIIYCSFCFKFCLAGIPMPSFLDLKSILDKTEQGASKLIETSRMSPEVKAKAHQAKSLLSGLARKLLPKKSEGEQLFLQRNCISQKFSRRSLSQYYNSMVDHPYQCESLNNGTDKFRRIIGCESESKNFVCYGISETDPVPEPDEDGNACYEVKNPSIPSILHIPKCHCESNILSRMFHVISFSAICLILFIFFVNIIMLELISEISQIILLLILSNRIIRLVFVKRF